MTVYITDFSEYATGSPPGDWTEYWHTGNFSLNIVESEGDGKTLHFDISSQERCACAWDDVGSIADVEILCKVKFKTGGGTASYMIGSGLRISGGSTNENGYSLFLSDPDNFIRLRRYVNGSGSSDLATASLSITNNTYYWVRFRAVGSNLKAKIWVDGDSEPGAWGIDYDDLSPYLSAGGAGLVNYNYDGWCDYFSADDLAGTTPSPTTIVTTLAPTTPPPTTAAPTAAPTTLPPTSLAPTTPSPTTLAPTTILPTSLPSTTLAPTTFLTTVAPTTVIPTDYCEKHLISDIDTELLLDSIIPLPLLLTSPITREIQIGDLCW